MKTDVKINGNGGPISVQLVFGFACLGTYNATLYDVNNQNGNQFQSGMSTDSSPDVVVVPGPAASLASRTLLITGALAPLAPPDMVSITAQVYQDGAAIPGAVLESKASVDAGQRASPMLFFRFLT